MMLGSVIGRVWSDRQSGTLAGRSFVIVRDLLNGTSVVAVDLLEVGVGADVLVATDEAAAAASGVSTIDAAVVALVSSHDPLPAHSPRPRLAEARP